MSHFWLCAKLATGKDAVYLVASDKRKIDACLPDRQALRLSCRFWVDMRNAWFEDVSCNAVPQ
jgi:hypothetical protein